MLKNYILITIRNMMRNKTVSIIHVTGFGLGMAAFLFAAQTVIFEYSFDDFHENGNRVYKIGQSYTSPNGEGIVTLIDPAIAHRVTDAMPEVQYVARFTPQTLEETYCVVTSTDSKGKQKSFNEPNAWYADADFMKIFQFPVIKGNAANALADNSSLIMTQSTAQKYFGDDDPIGKTLELTTGGTESNKTKYVYQVAAILQDLPENSSIQFDILLPFRNFEENYKQDLKDLFVWHFSFHNFIITQQPLEDYGPLESKLNALYPDALRKEEAAQGWSSHYELLPLEKIHFDPNEGNVMGITRLKVSSKTFVWIIGIIGLAILIIAGVNYINLTTAKALKRAKEIGIRKVVGAGRRQLIAQFMLDALAINALGLLFAMTLLQIIKPLLAIWLGLSSPQMNWWSMPSLLFMLMMLSSILISGILPALMLTRMQPVVALKGKVTRTAGGVFMRQGLVVFQFAVSVMLIIFTYALIMQLSFMRDKDSGFEMDQRMAIHALGTEDFDLQKFKMFKKRILTIPKVINATASQDQPGFLRGGGQTFINPFRPTEKISIPQMMVEFDFAATLGIEMKAGREFTEDRMTGEKVMMISESAVKIFGFPSNEDAIGKTVVWNWAEGPMKLKIIGVVGDTDMRSQKASSELVYFYANTAHPYPKFSHYLVHIAPGQMDETIALLKREWEAMFPNAPFEYSFLDQSFQKIFEQEEKMQSVATLSTLLALIIACMGLGGLVAYSVTQRTKEIGIRKTLGASLSRILYLLSSDFIKLIFVATVIAIPVVWYAIQKFLENYNYRIEISLWMFVVPCLFLVGIAIATISFQTVRAASANPVDSLKCE